MTSARGKPAAIRRAAIRSDASVVSPDDSVVLVSISSFRMSRPRGFGSGDACCATSGPPASGIRRAIQTTMRPERVACMDGILSRGCMVGACVRTASHRRGERSAPWSRRGVGALVSAALVLYATRQVGAPLLLQVLFAGWVVAPFGLLFVGLARAPRWPASVRATMATVSVIVAAASVLAYGVGAFGLSRPRAPVFVLGPPITSAVAVVAVIVRGRDAGAPPLDLARSPSNASIRRMRAARWPGIAWPRRSARAITQGGSCVRRPTTSPQPPRETAASWWLRATRRCRFVRRRLCCAGRVTRDPLSSTFSLRSCRSRGGRSRPGRGSRT